MLLFDRRQAEFHNGDLAASLKANPDVEVSRMPANTAALSLSHDELAPAVVAFDLDELPGDLAISLLRDRPELILIGVDPSSDRMLLLSGRQEQPVSAAELLQSITHGARPTPVEGSDAYRSSLNLSNQNKMGRSQ